LLYDWAHPVPSKNVIAGLDPAIQQTCEIGRIYAGFLDRRVKPGDDSFGKG
jgi:hypothetical protein